MATNHKPTKRKNILRWMWNRLRRLECTPEQYRSKQVNERVAQLKAQIKVEEAKKKTAKKLRKVAA